MQSKTKGCFKIFSPPVATAPVTKDNVVHQDVMMVLFFHYLARLVVDTLRSDTWSFVAYQLLNKAKSFYPKNEIVSLSEKNKTTYTFMSSIEEELVECGKSIFFENSKNVRLWFGHLSSSYHWLKFSVSIIPVIPTVVGWHFETYDGTMGTRVKKLFVNFLEAGVFSKAYSMEGEIEFQTRRRTSTRSIIKSMMSNGHNKKQRGQKMGEASTQYLLFGVCCC
ncbi:hypothetical protein Fcan01_15748 [Folsomia candida]|uniref:Uncharacterized protein n=1 Tax=Folsomia candida TaxID=158441 RepID=A0A226DXS0_FOLCA|nr:hypothetical protein Fcan01_15748 [Folsomia candida]